MLAHTSQGYATTPSMQGYLRWAQVMSHYQAYQRFSLALNFLNKYMNFISKRHFNFERKQGRKGMNTIGCKSCLPWTRCGKKIEICLEILWMGIMASQINKPEN